MGAIEKYWERVLTTAWYYFTPIILGILERSGSCTKSLILCHQMPFFRNFVQWAYQQKSDLLDWLEALFPPPIIGLINVRTVRALLTAFLIMFLKVVFLNKLYFIFRFIFLTLFWYHNGSRVFCTSREIFYNDLIYISYTNFIDIFLLTNCWNT